MQAIFALVLAIVPIHGDAIGPTSSFTDNTGGFSATTGVPAVKLSLAADKKVVGIEAVVFGVVEQADYAVGFWSVGDYFAGTPGIWAEASPVRFTPWGMSGVAGGLRPTFLGSFEVEPTFDFAAGDWIVGFRAAGPNVLVAGTGSEDGPVSSAYERVDAFPRSYIPVSWAMNVLAEVDPADFNGDGVVDSRDFSTWQAEYGETKTGDDFLAWQRAAGYDPDNYQPVPEPGLMLVVWAAFCFFLLFAEK